MRGLMKAPKIKKRPKPKAPSGRALGVSDAHVYSTDILDRHPVASPITPQTHWGVNASLNELVIVEFDYDIAHRAYNIRVRIAGSDETWVETIQVSQFDLGTGTAQQTIINMIRETIGSAIRLSVGQQLRDLVEILSNDQDT